MVESAGSAAFPVIFFNGQREINIGNIRIHPSLDFKIFQSIISQKIGISPNNMTMYFIDRKKPKSSPECRKILISGKVNFSLIAREKDCYFYVTLKRSRREKRRILRQGNLEFDEHLLVNMSSPSPDNLFLLRRNQSEFQDPQLSDYVSGYYNDNFQNMRMPREIFQNSQMERENYINMISNSNYGPNLPLNVNLSLDSFPKIKDSLAISNQALCEQCTDAKKKGKAAPFHCCVYDPIIVGFRTSSGPIARPF